jgi:hypothetical protein
MQDFLAGAGRQIARYHAIFRPRMTLGASLVALSATLSIAASPLHGQIAVDRFLPETAPAAADARATELVAAVRTALITDPSRAAAQISDRLPPYAREVDLGGLVTDISGWGLAVIGCREAAPVVGFYSPLDHVWVIAAAGPRGEVLDATLARGFWLDDSTSVWWPILWSQPPGSISLPPAIEADTAFQVEAFGRVFPSRDCPDLDNAPSVSPLQALDQLAELEADAPRPALEESDLFVADLGRALDIDLSAWRMRYLLPNTGSNWIGAFTSPERPGLVLFGAWAEREDGYAHHAGSFIVDLHAALEDVP